MLKIRAFSWSGDTLEGAKYLTGTNGMSGFVAWDDPFWDFIPAGTALKKIVVGVYAVRDTVINGDSMRFFSDVVWAETLRLAPPSLVSANVVADSGIRIAWDGAPLWASHVAATLIHPTMFPKETSWGPRRNLTCRISYFPSFRKSRPWKCPDRLDECLLGWLHDPVGHLPHPAAFRS